jgi:hypothetical protein
MGYEGNRPSAGRIGVLGAVRAGERRLAAYLVLTFFLLSAGLAIGRGTADALFFKRYGIEYLPLVFLALGGLLAAAGTVYTAFVDRVPAERSGSVIAIVLAVLLAAGWWGMTTTHAEPLYPAYYLTYEVASELLLVHAPLYLSQNLDTQAAKRLSPLVFAGGQVGTVFGGLLLGLAAGHVEVQDLLLLWAGFLVAGIAATVLWHRRRGASAYFRAPRRGPRPLRAAAGQVAAGVRLARHSPLVRRASLSLFFLVIAFYVLAYAVNRVYTEAFPGEAELATFFGLLIAVNSLLALLLQVFVTGRLIDRIGLRRTNLVFPLTLIASYAALIVHFALPSAVAASVSKDAVMPGVRNPVRAMFLNVMPQGLQGRARAVQVLLVMPLALAVSGAVLWLVQGLETPLLFLGTGALAAALYLYYSHRMSQAYAGTILEHLQARVCNPPDDLAQGMRGAGTRAFEALVRGVEQPDEEVAVSFARVLVSSFPGRAAPVLLARVRGMSDAGADRLVRVLATVPAALHGALSDRAQAGDPHLRATVLRALASQPNGAFEAEVRQALAAPHPRLAAAAVHGALRLADASPRQTALRVWQGLLEGPADGRLAALDLIADLRRVDPAEREPLREGYRAAFRSLLDLDEETVSLRVLRALAAWDGPPLPEVEAAVVALAAATNPLARAAAVSAARWLPAAERREAIAREALADGHQRVRDAATDLLLGNATGAAFRDLAQRWIIVGRQGSPRAQATLLEALMAQGLPHSVLVAAARARAADARWLEEALSRVEAAVRSGQRRFALLEQTLRERVAQTVDVALLALQGSGDGEAFAAVRAALRSGDARFRADAREALANLGDREVAGLLAGVLRDPEDRLRATAPGRFRDADEAARWCTVHGDPWLSACARHAATGAPSGEAAAVG